MYNIYKFTETSKDLKDLEDSNIFIAVMDAEKGNLKALKNMFAPFSFGIDNLLQGIYKLQGWAFDIRKYCKKYLVKFRYSNYYSTYYAINKTCLYNAFGKYNIIDIIEYKK